MDGDTGPSNNSELRPLQPCQPSPAAADSEASQPPWTYDIATEHASLTTTGGRIWPAARRLAGYLEALCGPLDLRRPGLRVLELGAGLGWLGMTLARNIAVDPGQGGMVVLTEQEAGGGLDWLHHNLRLNAAALGLGLGLEAGSGTSAGRPEGQEGREGQQQGQGQPAAAAAVRAEACDWFLYCNGPPDRMGPGGVAVVGGSSSGGGGGGTESGSGGVGGGATAATASARAYAEPLAPGTSLAAAAGLAAAAATAGPAGGAAAATCGGEGCSGAAGPDGGGDGPGGGCGGGGGEWLSGVDWDLIIGSDLVYNEVGAVYLPRVLRALARPGHTRILYAHTKHRFDTWDMRFYEELEAQGLSCVEVHEPGQPSPPPSPPPLTELFPEMRVAVFEIQIQISARAAGFGP